jgi:O-antigen/teichoic acid export membrane protein
MGLYSMVLIAISALEIVPLAVGQVVYPRMAQDYGRGRTVSDIVRLARKPMLYSAAGMVPVVIVGWLLMPILMKLIIPAYVDAVPAMRWGLILAFLTCFQAVTAAFNVARRQDLYVAAILLGVVTYGGSLLLLVRHGVYLAAFPQSMIVGRLVFVIACYVFIWYLQKRKPRTNVQ